MSCWDDLPIEIRAMILGIRYELRIESANIIKKYFKKHICKEYAAIDIVLNIDCDEGGDAITVLPYTATALEYCAKNISGKMFFNTWKEILVIVDRGLFNDEFIGGHGAQYYNRSEAAFNIIVDLFYKENVVNEVE